MEVISITDGRKKLGELVNLVKYQRRVIALGRHGKAEVLLVSIPDHAQEIPLTAINAESPSFAFLNREPELYSVKDLKKRYV